MAARTGSAGAVHDAFEAWCRSQNVEIQHVRAARIPGRGLGIVAVEPIKEGTQLIRAPPESLFTVDCLPEAFIAKHPPDTRVHSLLASYLVNGASDDAGEDHYAAWKAIWPTHEDFARCMPLLWPRQLREPWADIADRAPFWPMPCALSGQHGIWDYTTKPKRKVKAESLVHKQERKLQAGLQAARHAFPGTDAQAYAWAWLIVNTRSFFYDLTRRPARKHNDKMILCPFIDYFNHADDGCRVEYDARGYAVTADRDYAPGAELFVSYGAHDSDLMLAEYGFVPRANRHDALCLDPWVLAPSTDLERRHARRLQKHAYLDRYYLSAVDGPAHVCWRTQTAVRAATMRPAKWTQFLRGRDLAGEGDADAHRFIQHRILQPFRDTVAESIDGLRAAPQSTWDRLREHLTGEQDPVKVEHIKESLILRWTQMLALIDSASAALQV